MFVMTPEVLPSVTGPNGMTLGPGNIPTPSTALALSGQGQMLPPRRHGMRKRHHGCKCHGGGAAGGNDMSSLVLSAIVFTFVGWAVGNFLNKSA
jgi:hypothetical protein